MKSKGKAQVYNKDTGKSLGQIKLLEMRETETVELDLQMEDELFNQFVGFGKRDATPEDFFSIAFRKMLAETISDLHRKKRHKNVK